MSSQLQPIETLYNGYRFRSLLEARWAVFFDHCGLRYEYEPEGFDLDGIWYLPDFYIPSLKQYFEVKPNKTHLDDWPEHPMFDWLSKREQWEPKFAVLLGYPYLSVSHVNVERYTTRCVNAEHAEHDVFYTCESDPGFEYNSFVLGDCYYRFCECPCCGKVGFEFDGRAGRIDNCGVYEKSYNIASPKLIRAYHAARSFRPGSLQGAERRWDDR